MHRRNVSNTDNFMKNLANDDLHNGHGTTELLASITPAIWHTEILG